MEGLDAPAEDHQPVATLAAFALKPGHPLQAALETLADTRGSGIARSQTGTFQLRQALLPHPLRHWVKAVHLRVTDDFLLLSDDARGLHQVLRKGKGEHTLEAKSRILNVTSLSRRTRMRTAPIFRRGNANPSRHFFSNSCKASFCLDMLLLHIVSLSLFVLSSHPSVIPTSVSH